MHKTCCLLNGYLNIEQANHCLILVILQDLVLLAKFDKISMILLIVEGLWIISQKKSFFFWFRDKINYIR